MIFNTHTHINGESNYDVLIKEAHDKGVNLLLVVGYDIKTSIKAIQIAEKYPDIYAAVGIHPSEVNKIKDDDILLIEKMLSHPKVVALGEIGLDYHYDNGPSCEIQKKYFELFIQMGAKYHKPLIIHMRDAIKDTYDLLSRYKDAIKKGVMHCYSGSKEAALDFIKLGYYISFSGALTFPNAVNLKEVARSIPLDKILVETDDPYLSPVPYRGKRNRPSNVIYVVEEIARLRNLSFDQVAHETTNNAKRLFLDENH